MQLKPTKWINNTHMNALFEQEIYECCHSAWLHVLRERARVSIATICPLDLIYILTKRNAIIKLWYGHSRHAARQYFLSLSLAPSPYVTKDFAQFFLLTMVMGWKITLYQCFTSNSLMLDHTRETKKNYARTHNLNCIAKHNLHFNIRQWWSGFGNVLHTKFYVVCALFSQL